MGPSSWPEHFRNLKLAQRELALPPLMENDYNACFCWALLLARISWETRRNNDATYTGKALERARSEVLRVAFGIVAEISGKNTKVAGCRLRSGGDVRVRLAASRAGAGLGYWFDGERQRH